MAVDRYTVAYRNQIKDAEITENELNASVAGVGITGGAGTALALDLNELTGAVVDVANDSVAIVDATDSSSKKETIADIMTAVAGDGLSSTSGVLAVNVDSTTIETNADTLRIAASAAGNGLTGGGASALALDLNELNTEATFDPNADFVPMVDATDSSSDKALWSVIATAIAGTGITATNGVLSADSVADNVVEADIQFDDFSATVNGVLTDFTLTDIPLTKSLQVFINGKYAIEGSGKDYKLNPDSGQTKTIRIAGDVMATGERLFVHYIIDN